MSQDNLDREVRPFPQLRRLMVDGGNLARQKHTIHGLAEIDVTRPRQLIRNHKAQTGEALSFTAFVIACLGQAVDVNREMHAYRNWRNQLVIFSEVDVNTLFEVDVEGRRVVAPYLMRAVNRKSLRELHDEIRTFQHQHETSREMGFIRWFVLLPTVVRRAFLRGMFKSPVWIKQYYGTVSMSSIGMFATGGFWGIPMPNHTLQITLGGMVERPAIVAGKLQTREYLSVTISVDHDIVDGAAVARFAQRLKELIESGNGLPNEL